MTQADADARLAQYALGQDERTPMTTASPIMLVTTAHPSLHEHPGPDGEPVHPMLGRLIQPRHTSSIEATASAGIPWAADNDCFQGLDERAFVAMMDRLAGLRGCLFVTVPDKVADARETAAMFDRWAPELEARGLPVALVLQDGIDEPELAEWLAGTWHRLAAVFVGGSDDFKLGPVAARLAREAKRRGKWVHWGRVNTKSRIKLIAETGAADSFDGSSWAIFRKAVANKRTGERKLDQGLRWCVETAKAAIPAVRTLAPVAGGSPEAGDNRTLTEMLDAMRKREAEDLAEYRKAAAELAILQAYDERRRVRYGDYGGGQRWAELSRRYNEVATLKGRLSPRSTVDLTDPTTDELREAFRKVGLPRLNRLRREQAQQDEYGGTTRPTRESIRAWGHVELALNMRGEA